MNLFFCFRIVFKEVCSRRVVLYVNTQRLRNLQAGSKDNAALMGICLGGHSIIECQKIKTEKLRPNLDIDK